MIYKEHGLTTEIAFNSALKKAGIEITSYVAPKEITTDAICTVDTTKHDEEIRADERAKTIDECFKAIREQAEKALRKQNQERHDKGLALYQQDFDCFSTHKIEFDIFREAEKQMKEQKNV